MTKKLFAAAAITVALLAPARADYLIKDGAGANKTIKAGTVSGTILPYSTPTDATGIPYSAANPLAITFGAGVTLPDFNQPQHFICDSGCGGGGGGGGLSVPFFGAIGANGTPVGFKDGSGNFQPLLGDVTNGQWVNIKASVPIAVTGTFFQATQPVSLASLPAYAATPTFNMGTIAGIATQTTLAAIQTALGSPLQTGGSIGNTSFGISGTLPAFAATPSVKLQDGSGNDISSTTGSLNVNITGGAGSGGTSSTFGAAFPTLGTAIGMSQGGNMVAMTGTSGNLNVQCANCSGSGVSTADGATFTAGSSLFAGAGGFFQTTATANPVTTGQQGLFQMTAQRALFTNLRNASGAEVGVAAVPLQVSLANTGANATALLVTGTGGTFPISGSISNTTFAATQASAAALNATVVGTGTFAVQAAQAGAWVVSGTGTAGSAASGVMTVQGIASMTPLLGNPGTAALWGVNTLGSTTSGQSGQLALGAVTTAAPSYTTAQSNALSLTTAGALRVDGSAVTQPVSGTVAFSNSTIAVTNAGTFAVQLTGATNNINNISGTISLPTGAGTSANQTTLIGLVNTNAATIAHGCSTAGYGVLGCLGQIDDDIKGPLPTQASTVSVGGVGLFSGGTIMSATNGLYTNLLQGNAVIASGNPLFAQLTAGTAIAGKFGIDQTTPGTTNGVQDAATSATGSAVPTKASFGGVIDEVGGNLAGLTGDPCQTGTKTTIPVTLATAAVKVIATGVSAKKIYVCQVNLTNNAADSVAVFEATTGTTCATSPVAVAGAGTSVATAATGYNFAANGGISLGSGGFKVWQTTVNNNDLCVAQSAATQLTGSITYVTR